MLELAKLFLKALERDGLGDADYLQSRRKRYIREVERRAVRKVHEEDYDPYKLRIRKKKKREKTGKTPAEDQKGQEKAKPDAFISKGKDAFDFAKELLAYDAEN